MFPIKALSCICAVSSLFLYGSYSIADELNPAMRARADANQERLESCLAEGGSQARCAELVFSHNMKKQAPFTPHKVPRSIYTVRPAPAFQEIDESHSSSKKTFPTGGYVVQESQKSIGVEVTEVKVDTPELTVDRPELTVDNHYSISSQLSPEEELLGDIVYGLYPPPPKPTPISPQTPKPNGKGHAFAGPAGPKTENEILRRENRKLREEIVEREQKLNRYEAETEQHINTIKRTQEAQIAIYKEQSRALEMQQRVQVVQQAQLEEHSRRLDGIDHELYRQKKLIDSALDQATIAQAMAGMPQATQGRSGFAMGAAYNEGRQGVAIGLSKNFGTKYQHTVKVSAGFAGSHSAATVGYGYEW